MPAYDKQVLLPFGEYIPGASSFPALKKWFPDVRDFEAGDGPVLLRMDRFLLGAQICYEGLFDSIARGAALLGAQMIVNVTNDSWYGTWLEPWQHLYVTMAKAVETRRPLIRATNSGVSAVAFADGTINELSPAGTEWFGVVEVPYIRMPAPTVFMGWGYWLDWVVLGISLAFLLALRRGRSRGATPGSAG